MAQKKSIFILVTAFIFMALVSTGCERSYAPIDASSLATPTVEGGEFPAPLDDVSSMDDLIEIGAQTATAEALAAAAPAVADEPTATPEAGEDTELTPAEDNTTEEAPTDEPADAATEETTPPTNTPEPTKEPTQEPVNVNDVPATYTLKVGEFPYCIARRYNVNPSELLTLNGLSTEQGGVYQPGLSLKLPQSGNPFPSPRARNVHPVTYVVPETSTVYGIACFFGDVDPAAIMSANPSVSNPNSIAGGTSLQIP